MMCSAASPDGSSNDPPPAAEAIVGLAFVGVNRPAGSHRKEPLILGS